MTRGDFFELLLRYAGCHYIERDGGREMWIDENLDPFTGEWLARKKMIEAGRDDWDRGIDYNHSTFCDLIISGLAGISVSECGATVSPLFEEDNLDYMCLDGALIHGKLITVLYDKDGTHYGRGKGLSVLLNGKKVAHSDKIDELSIAF